MEKKNFIKLVSGVVGGLLFSLGMCMCLLPEWNMFTAGVIFTAVGAVILLVTLFVHCKQTGVKIKLPSAKIVLKTLYGLVAILVFGLGMCMVMVFEGMMLFWWSRDHLYYESVFLSLRTRTPSYYLSWTKLIICL